ncbi:hypothetical protein K438DRAFT_869951 [Mycena galopus ATCC 62051]|nr:hypothetical protein K438DRAFT_869951 [Mycena galopus ATCC 62051]
MAEKATGTLRARRGTRRRVCAPCQRLKIQCEYRNLGGPCERCKAIGLSCRVQESAIGDTVEVALAEEEIQLERRPLARRLALRILSTCTPYFALEAATSDPDCEQIVETLKSEWLNVGRWFLALGAVDMSLLAIDSQSLFKIDLFSQKVIAASSAATGLGLLCDAWFLARYYPLQPRMFMARARDVYGSYAFFSLSARLPSLAILISILALGAFVGHVAYQTMPAFVIVLGVVFAVVMGLQYIVWGSEVFYCSIAKALSTVAGWMQHLREKARSAIRNESD